MAEDTRHKDGQWNLGPPNINNRFTWDQIQTALLMDLRDELKEIHYLMSVAGRALHAMHLEQQRIRRYLAGPMRKPKKKWGV